MGTKIVIHAGGRKFRGELNDTPTAKAVIDALPLEANGNWWGDEIYFNIPVNCDPEPDARAEFGVGELGYWPPGSAFCIFYGPTPVSRDGTPRMANRGNPIGWITDDPKKFRDIKRASKIRVELVPEPNSES